ncbi:MAG: tRNA uridine-5-carboxymethylaminomethyl(34) synthesis GTPase MnmE [Sedimentisphaerales bacterium]|nr:tRNA uridine-5-carboxymethylaminomethyl(34) synthesis GTPase MnmE [Sedimentisphaerales bacterium]
MTCALMICALILMYNVNDTIVAISSPTSQQRVIVRVAGPEAFKICRRIFRTHTGQNNPTDRRQILSGNIAIKDKLEVEALLYQFPSPHSYTGDDIVEVHLYTNPSVTQALVNNLLGQGLRMAEPGEFTARAYLNGKMDLSQAEAVNEIIVSSNKFQLDAAEKLLSGQLSLTTAKIRSQIIECLSLIEAGLDFSGEDIEFITKEQALERLSKITKKLRQLLAGSIRYESVIELPAAGIAGAPNAGKSSLVNKLLGTERSIVSHESKTTRDVLTGLLELEHCNCVLFDCAGLISEPEDILDELSRQAATEAIRNSDVVVFCIDISKSNWSEDCSIRELIKPKNLISVANKCDLVSNKDILARLADLNRMFGVEFLPISAKTGTGLEQLRQKIDSQLVSGQTYAESPLAITARHKQTVTEAIANLDDAVNELSADNDEVAAMILRAAYQGIGGIEQHDPALDEQILEQVFSRFCIGK